jgi:hypothetical protein
VGGQNTLVVIWTGQSGIARLSGSWGKQSQWLPLREVVNFTKEIGIIYFFPFIWLNNLIKGRKYKFITQNINFATHCFLHPAAATPINPTPAKPGNINRTR